MESKEFDKAYNKIIADSRFTNLIIEDSTLELFATELWNQALEDAAEKCEYAETNSAVARTIKKQILSLKKQ